MTKLPEIGSHVRVPWGLDYAEGEVIDAYESGIGAQVVVAVRLEGSDAPLTITVPADLVELAELA